jgi:hypothetical protein
VDRSASRPSLAPSAWWLASLVLVLHVGTAGRYGYFGDELYYLACARRPAWGYPDLGPASIALLRAWTGLVGTSLVAIRIVPAIASAVTVLLTALLARRLGGEARAQTIAALAVAVGPGFLIVGHYYSMNAFDPVCWSLAALALMRALGDGRPASWAMLGLVLGVGMLNKLSFLWLGGGIALALAVTQPGLYVTSGPWIMAAVAAAVTAPMIVWQTAHGWPTLEFVRNVLAYELAPVPVTTFFRNQALLVHPVVMPIAVLGLVRLLGGPAIVCGITYLTSLALLLGVGTSRAYYLLGAYPPLLAAGAVWLERLAARRAWPWLPPATGALVLAGGLATLPLAVPVLPVDRLIAYVQAIGFRNPQEDLRVTGDLPGHFANMCGWPEIVADVESAAAELSRPSRAVVLADDYMEAGALEELGRAVGLPPVVGTHDSWAMWPAPLAAPEQVILVGAIADRAFTWFDDVRIVGRIACTHCLPWRAGRAIAIGSGLRTSFATVLAEARHFD